MDTEILIDILKATPGVLISAVVTYYFSQRKYTFERLYDRKIMYLEEIFEKIVLLEKCLKRYVMTTGSMIGENTIEDRIEALKPVLDNFFEFQEYFWKKEIIFNQETIDAVQSFIDFSIQILSDLQVSNISSQLRDHKTALDKWNQAYQTMSKELSATKLALKEDFRVALENSR